MKKLLHTLLLGAVASLGAAAMPAFPRQLAVVANGDTSRITLRGDEYCKYAVDSLGYTLLNTNNGWVYAIRDSLGYAVPSRIPLGAPAPRTASRNIKPRRTAAPSTSMTSAPATGNRRVLIIMMAFADVPFSLGADAFNDLFNGEDYRYDGANGSVRDFYTRASYGQLLLQCDILGPFTSSYPRRFYGENSGIGGGDTNPFALFSEALEHARTQVNLADYDADGDGYVDNIHIIYAGHGEEAGAPASAIWAHEMTFEPITVDGMKINKYSCAPELRGNMGNRISRIGPHCHEIGHALGAMDFYDTDYEQGGSFSGTGIWDVMAQGSWNDDGVNPATFNPYTRVHDFGWTTAAVLPTGEVTIAPSDEPGNIYRLESGNAGDYFLLENRLREANDISLPSEGLLIFHVGPEIRHHAAFNTINSRYPQQCYPVAACATTQRPSNSPASYGDINSAGCPWPGSSGAAEFSATSIPAALNINGEETGISLSNIRRECDNIILLNESLKGDEPDTPDRPADNAIWRESFESLDALDNWTVSPTAGRPEASVVIKLSHDDSPSSPIATHGHGYMKIAHDEGIVIMNSPMGIRMTARQPALLPAGSYRFGVMVRISSGSDLTVTLGDPEIAVIVSDIGEWHQVSTVFTLAEPALFVPSLELNAPSPSVTIFVDNLSITSADDSAITDASADAGNRYEAFDLQGRRISGAPRGLRIERSTDGRVHKILR